MRSPSSSRPERTLGSSYCTEASTQASWISLAIRGESEGARVAGLQAVERPHQLLRHARRVHPVVAQERADVAVGLLEQLEQPVVHLDLVMRLRDAQSAAASSARRLCSFSLLTRARRSTEIMRHPPVRGRPRALRRRGGHRRRRATRGATRAMLTSRAVSRGAGAAELARAISSARSTRRNSKSSARPTKKRVSARASRLARPGGRNAQNRVHAMGPSRTRKRDCVCQTRAPMMASTPSRLLPPWSRRDVRPSGSRTSH